MLIVTDGGLEKRAYEVQNAGTTGDTLGNGATEQPRCGRPLPGVVIVFCKVRENPPSGLIGDLVVLGPDVDPLDVNAHLERARSELANSFLNVWLVHLIPISSGPRVLVEDL